MTTNLARIREAKLPNFAEVKAMSLVDAYFATATFLLNQETVLSIYGGFVRDLVLRDDFHSELDIDVHVSESTIQCEKHYHGKLCTDDDSSECFLPDPRTGIHYSISVDTNLLLLWQGC